MCLRRNGLGLWSRCSPLNAALCTKRKISLSEEDKKNEIVSGSNENKDDDLDLSPFFSYLTTPQGHEISSRVLGIFEDIKKSALEHTSKHSITEKWIQATIILSVVLASSVLAHFGKFDSSMGVLFGTLVGYLFGKR